MLRIWFITECPANHANEAIPGGALSIYTGGRTGGRDLRHGLNPKKGGFKQGHNPKIGGLRRGHTPKKGVLGTGTSRKRGVLGTSIIILTTICPYYDHTFLITKCQYTSYIIIRSRQQCNCSGRICATPTNWKSLEKSSSKQNVCSGACKVRSKRIHDPFRGG